MFCFCPYLQSEKYVVIDQSSSKHHALLKVNIIIGSTWKSFGKSGYSWMNTRQIHIFFKISNARQCSLACFVRIVNWTWKSFCCERISSVFNLYLLVVLSHKRADNRQTALLARPLIRARDVSQLLLTTCTEDRDITNVFLSNCLQQPVIQLAEFFCWPWSQYNTTLASLTSNYCH